LCLSSTCPNLHKKYFKQKKIFNFFIFFVCFHLSSSASLIESKIYNSRLPSTTWQDADWTNLLTFDEIILLTNNDAVFLGRHIFCIGIHTSKSNPTDLSGIQKFLSKIKTTSVRKFQSWLITHYHKFNDYVLTMGYIF